MGLKAEIGSIQRELGAILKQGAKIMAAIDDLRAAIAALSTAVSDDIAEIEVLLSGITPGVPEADVQGAVATIKTLTANIVAELAKAKNPTPVVTPTPAPTAPWPKP